VSEPFKTCPACRTSWPTRDAFLADPDIRLLGYQVNFAELALGYFDFNHLRVGCFTTLGVEAGLFTDLYAGPIYATRATGTPDCPELCLHRYDLQPCPAHCECASIRDIMQVVRGWPKRRPG
jgi:hypothetical protein